MKNKILIVVLSYLSISILLLILFFCFNDKESISKFKNNIIEENEKNIINNNENKDSTLNTKENIEESKVEVNKENLTTSPTHPKAKDEKVEIENKTEVSTPKNENIVIDEEKNKDTSSIIENNIPEEEKEVVDYELENLLKQVEYSTYEECMQMGFTKNLEDTINIFGFSCPYIVYKGQILGYRLQLDYSNPMEN